MLTPKTLFWVVTHCSATVVMAAAARLLYVQLKKGED
jgi:hypothetical protein